MSDAKIGLKSTNAETGAEIAIFRHLDCDGQEGFLFKMTNGGMVTKLALSAGAIETAYALYIEMIRLPRDQPKAPDHA